MVLNWEKQKHSPDKSTLFLLKYTIARALQARTKKDLFTKFEDLEVVLESTNHQVQLAPFGISGDSIAAGLS